MRDLRTTKKPKIVAKHIYTSIIKLYQHESLYYIIQQVYSITSLRKYVNINNKKSTITDLSEFPEHSTP